MLLNVNLIRAFYKMGLPAYYGSVTATIIGFIISFVICLFILHNKYKVNYEDVVKSFIDILCGSMLMIVILYLIKFIIPIYSVNRFINILYVLIYSIIGCFIYFLYTYKIGLVKRIFGNKILLKLKRKK